MTTNNAYSAIGSLISTPQMNEALMVSISHIEKFKSSKQSRLIHRCDLRSYSTLALDQLGTVDNRYTRLSSGFVEQVVFPALASELLLHNQKTTSKSTSLIYPSYGDFMKGMNYFLKSAHDLALTDEDKIVESEITKFRLMFQEFKKAQAV